MMNLADPELELVDPTPNVHTLFIHFDKEFFSTKLASRAVVRWSKRMYSCAGICSYEGRGGLCDIALSEPLLKLRPRKDLVETLLHEMIHAFLFVTNRDQDRDGHGPNFQYHMNRINKSAGLNISIYHSFHDEVHLYLTHWWRCDGPCLKRRPHFGIVRRSNNRAPGPSDYWWNEHKRKCGGTFIKIKEPENFKAKKKNSGTSTTNTSKKNESTKTNGKQVPKDSNSNLKTKSTGSNFNPTSPKPQVPLFTGNGHTINGTKHISDHRNVTEHVRRIWANKEIPSVINKAPLKKVETSMSVKKQGKISSTPKPNKQKATDTNIPGPPAKMKKIDEYFKATSVLKEIYGEDFRLIQEKNNTKLVAVRKPVNVELVDCPTCNAKIDSNKINEHLDECLNRDIIKELSQDNELAQTTSIGSNLVQTIGNIPAIPAFKGNIESTPKKIIDLTNLNMDPFGNKINSNKDRRKSDSQTILQSTEHDKVTLLKKKDDKTSQILDPNLNKMRKSDNFITKDKGVIFSVINSESSSGTSNKPQNGSEPSIKEVEPVPSSSKDSERVEQMCPCCGKKIDKPVVEHLDECRVFSDINNTMSEEDANTSFSNHNTVVINDDDDMFDESQEFNETGTKTPCPCCMKMVEEISMNDHLDLCLG
ncbi:unnamed protein product [Arctia plantaginis]|uniref:Protein with SprT-like domain at the N terminus n=1 Tax=Arctia plantaginis TaxID=874455 RepID=A0A8S0ZYA0_ARCPL|nr:unnamed protein product [Arctia plantaginis]CAB3238774.1 unnamed protein product [Arctia plantaginis]